MTSMEQARPTSSLMWYTVLRGFEIFWHSSLHLMFQLFRYCGHFARHFHVNVSLNAYLSNFLYDRNFHVTWCHCRNEAEYALTSSTVRGRLLKTVSKKLPEWTKNHSNHRNVPKKSQNSPKITDEVIKSQKKILNKLFRSC